MWREFSSCKDLLVTLLFLINNPKLHVHKMLYNHGCSVDKTCF